MAVATSTIIAGAGLALAGFGAFKQHQAAKQQTAAANKSERLRETQMNLDSARQRRAIIRETIMARAIALSNANAQGAQAGTALGGAYGGIQAQGGSNMNYNSQSTTIGSGLFAANRQINNAGGMASFGQGISSLGGTLINNAQTMGRVFDYGFGRMKQSYAN